MVSDYQYLTEQAIKIAYRAGLSILGFFEHGDYQKFDKKDESPVTSADYAANEIIMSELKALAPDIPIMSEESEGLEFEARKNWTRYWLVDPLDGTQEFVAGRPDFATNIALIENGKPVIGVIHAPVSNTTYYAIKGLGTKKIIAGKTETVTAQSINQDKPYLRVAISRVQTLETITKYIKPDISIEFISLGSAALKSCLVAEGVADIYLRVGPTGEWDTGAPQVIVEEAGGCIIDSEFNALSYNERESLLNPDFIVAADKTFDWSTVIIGHHSRRD